MKKSEQKRIIIGITGASGAIFGIEILRELKKTDFETHLIISDSGKKVIDLEANLSVKDVEGLADHIHNIGDMESPLASASFITIGMIVAPCSIKTLSGIANSYSDNLLLRAADVTLKEERKLILLVRETPFHKGHLRLMGIAADMGAQILPPIPSFYHRPKTIGDIISHIVGKVFDNFGIENRLYQRWGEKR